MSQTATRPAPSAATFLPPGLAPAAVAAARAAHGRNILLINSTTGWWTTIKEVVLEPMFLLLLAACAVYFGLGRTQEAVTLIVALWYVHCVYHQAVSKQRKRLLLQPLRSSS